MPSKRAWEAYEITYRAQEMRTLVGWIQAGQSGSVLGLPGAGKSNLLGFLSHRPDAVSRYLSNSSFKLAVVQVDLNNLPADDLATFYRVILRALYEAGAQMTGIDRSLADAVETLYRKAEDKTDPFVAQSALREAFQVFQQQAAHLALVMDPFDRFCRTAPTQVLDNLRGLRDAFKATLTYLVGLRQELAYARDPIELGELYEILDSQACWVGPLVHADARFVIAQVEETTGQSFTKNQITHLIDLTGGYAALLRAASSLLAETRPMPAVPAWENRLQAASSIHNRLNDIWQALTGEEQAALAALQLALAAPSAQEQHAHLRPIEEKYKRVLNHLQTKQLCLPTEASYRLFSPLFAAFVAGGEGVNAGRIRHDPTTDRFFRGETEITDLSEQDRRLLHHFLAQPLIAHTIDDLIEVAWADYDHSGITNQAVQQAIRHLRKQIELNPARPTYLVTEHGAGYRFFPEGAPREQP